MSTNKETLKKPELYTLLSTGLSTDEAFALLPMNVIFKREDGCNYHYHFNLKRGYYEKEFTAEYKCLQNLSESIKAKADTPKQALVNLYIKLIELNLVEPCT